MTDARRLFRIALMLASSLVSAAPVWAAIVNGDALELAIEPPVDAVKFKDNSYQFFASDAYSYDDNVYRLSPDVVNLETLAGIGPHASRSDHIDVASLGFDGVWNPGRQTVSADLQVDDNRFSDNSNLDNVSTNDKLALNWNIGSMLSGKVGTNYSRGLISFVNAASYARDIYAVSSYYAAGRYQFGPRWALFGGVLDSSTTLSDAALRDNDLHTKSAAIGTDFATGEKDSVGFEYRFTDAKFPVTTAFNSDYREDAERVVVRHAFSEKTNIDANFGFLKRDYTSAAIESFSGDVWRIGAQWLPTDKVTLEVDAYRNLQAYLTEQSDYYVAKGERLGPQWLATEKITVGMSLGFEDQNYVGVGASQLAFASRRDTLTTTQANVKYTPFDFLVFDFSYAYEKRNSNESRFQYKDNLLTAKVAYKH